jgi:hypothetical protein
MLFQPTSNPLTKHEVEELKGFLYGKTDKLETGENLKSLMSGKIDKYETGFDCLCVSATEIKRLNTLSEKKKLAERQLEEADRPVVVEEKWIITEEIRLYVRQRDQYATRVIQEWYNIGGVPYGLEFPPELCEMVNEKLNALHETEKVQQEHLQAMERYEKQLMEYWAPYKVEFECWNKPQQITFPIEAISYQKDDVEQMASARLKEITEADLPTEQKQQQESEDAKPVLQKQEQEFVDAQPTELRSNPKTDRSINYKEKTEQED